jgi:hypothetical protein
MKPLSPAQARLLRAIANGCALKVHRDVDGGKTYRLHALDGTTQTARRATVEALLARGLLDSNKKFPAATFWLTEAGKSAAT